MGEKFHQIDPSNRDGFDRIALDDVKEADLIGKLYSLTSSTRPTVVIAAARTLFDMKRQQARIDEVAAEKKALRNQKDRERRAAIKAEELARKILDERPDIASLEDELRQQLKEIS